MIIEATYSKKITVIHFSKILYKYEWNNSNF